MSRFLLSLLRRSAYVLLGVLYVVYLAYTVFPLMDLVVDYVAPLSWFVKVPAFLAFGVLSTAIALVGSLPLFWLDRVTRGLRSPQSKTQDSSEHHDK